MMKVKQLVSVHGALILVQVCYEDLFRAEGRFGRILFYSKGLSPSFSPQTLIIVFNERDTLGMIIMIMYLIESWYQSINHVFDIIQLEKL